jgi:hypothetical protein
MTTSLLALLFIIAFFITVFVAFFIVAFFITVFIVAFFLFSLETIALGIEQMKVGHVLAKIIIPRNSGDSWPSLDEAIGQISNAFYQESNPCPIKYNHVFVFHIILGTNPFLCPPLQQGTGWILGFLVVKGEWLE